MNDLDPEILEEQQELFFHLQQQRLIELIRGGRLAEALEFAQARPWGLLRLLRLPPVPVPAPVPALQLGGGVRAPARRPALGQRMERARPHALRPGCRSLHLPPLPPLLLWQEYLAPRGEDHPELLEELGAPRGWGAARLPA